MSKDAKEHWDTIYQTKQSQEVSWYQEIPETSLRLITGLGLPENARIIDVGAGDSTLVGNLLALGFKDITILDISQAALERAQKRVGRRKDDVQWIVSDVRELGVVDARYDLWHDRAVLHFLTKEEDRKSYAAAVEQNLNYRGCFIVAAFSLQGPQKCSGLDVRQYSEESMRKLFCNLEHIQSFEEKHVTPWGTSQRFLYSVFRKR